ncbi:hypothetical protein WR25_02755 [Diploscapter pachys]|uniref:C3H1-type domain-containing protein n=1 Tax=Diploscapter pachys TaxID=2018661 RepID=A0A2A2LRX6_9BILA|nr:hypothetical protein WR25_02755 [Diploscapter pachys]
MYHAASVPHLGQPSAEQNEYVYQAAPQPRPYTAFAPVQYSYGPVYSYAPASSGSVQYQPMQPGPYPAATAPAQQFYPMAAGDYPMQFYAPVPMYASTQFLPSTYSIAPASSFGYQQQQQQQQGQGQTEISKHLAPPQNSENPKTPPQTAAGSKQVKVFNSTKTRDELFVFSVGSPMHTSTPLRGSSMDAGNPSQQQSQHSILWRQQQTPSARLRQSSNAARGRQGVPSDNLISCIFPSDEDLHVNGNSDFNGRHPVVRRTRDTTSTSGELLTSTRLHNNSSPSFLCQHPPAIWRGFPKQSRQMQDLEDRVHRLKMQDGQRKELNGHDKQGRQDIPQAQDNAFRKPLPAAAQNLKYKTKFCRNEEDSGTCPYGARCLFLHRHEIDEMDKMKMQLNGDKANGNGVEQRRRETKGPAELQLNPAEAMDSRKCNISRFRSIPHLPSAGLSNDASSSAGSFHPEPPPSFSSSAKNSCTNNAATGNGSRSSKHLS